MMEGLVFAFATGLLVKVTDFLIDEPNRFRDTPLAMVTAGMAGVAGGMMLSHDSVLATLGLAIMAGVLLARKVDGAHQFTVAIALLIFFMRGIPDIEFGFLVGFIVFGYMDEMVVGKYRMLSQKTGGYRLPPWQAWLVEERLLLVFATIGISYFSGNYGYLYGMLAFQAGYDLAREGMQRVKGFTPQTSAGAA